MDCFAGFAKALRGGRRACLGYIGIIGILGFGRHGFIGYHDLFNRHGGFDLIRIGFFAAEVEFNDLHQFIIGIDHMHKRDHIRQLAGTFQVSLVFPVIRILLPRGRVDLDQRTLD